MSRLLPLVAFALLPAAAAAPVPPGGRAEFGSGGLLTRADLGRVKFASHPAKDDGEAPESKLEGGAKFDVAVHMPWTTFRPGEAVPAYFVLKNTGERELALDARLELFGPAPAVWNSCRINVRVAATGRPVYLVARTGWMCGGGGLVDVPAGGFYCVRGELGGAAAGGALPPGEYEVDWRYAGVASAPVKFTVTKADGTTPKLAPRPAVRFYRLSPEREVPPGKAGGAFGWSGCRLEGEPAGAVSAALAVGQAGVFVPDVHTVPPADGLVVATAEWRPYRDGDRLLVTLRAAAPHRQVRFAERPHLHLQVESAADDGGRMDHEKAGDLKHAAAESLVTPLTIELRLPAGWRERSGVHDSARVAVLVTSRELELPTGRAVQKVQKELRSVERVGATIPVWSGVVRTEFAELRFPPRPPSPKGDHLPGIDW